MKRILRISLMIILVAGTLFLVSFADKKHRVQRYKSFSIEVLNESDDALICEKEIRELIYERFGKIEGNSMALINLEELESTVRNHSYISVCEVFPTISGDLVLKTRVRAPLIRVMNDSGQQYFIDNLGYMVPVTFNHPSLVPVASGNISERFISIDKSEKSIHSLPDNSVLRQIYPVARMISQDEFLRSFIDQIYVNDKQELELVPRIGSQEILFGTAENAAQKLENLKTFYQKVMSRMDWNNYKVINVKYNNQVVCSK